MQHLKAKSEEGDHTKEKRDRALSKNNIVLRIGNASRAGDGSDPFRRYEYCFNEYLDAIENLIDENGKSKVDINVSAFTVCIDTYKNNMTVMINHLTDIINSLKQSKQQFLQILKSGLLPSYHKVKNIVFGNKMLVTQAKQLSVQVIQFQTIFCFVFGAICSNEDFIMYMPEDSP